MIRLQSTASRVQSHTVTPRPTVIENAQFGFSFIEVASCIRKCFVKRLKKSPSTHKPTLAKMSPQLWARQISLEVTAIWCIVHSTELHRRNYNALLLYFILFHSFDCVLLNVAFCRTVRPGQMRDDLDHAAAHV